FLMGLLLIFLISSDNQIISHVSLILFIVCMSTMMLPIANIPDSQRVFVQAIGLLVVLSLIVYTFNVDLSKYGNILLIVLVALILVQLLDLIFGTINKAKYKFYSIVIVLLFSMFIMYDTGVLYRESKNIIEPINYPAKSLNLF